MRPDPLTIRISAPDGELPQSRGFYQLEENALYVPIGVSEKSRHFFSWLESPSLRLDLDKSGRLMFIEVSAGRHTWIVVDDMPTPNEARTADIRWLGFRSTIADPTLLSDWSRSRLLIRFTGSPIRRQYLLADTVVLSVDALDRVVSILVTDIIDDLAGREIARFRKEQQIQNQCRPTG